MFLTQQKVLWKTDNFGVSRIVNKGSPINELQKMAENIYDFCRSENIFLKIIWEPRDNFELANELSKAIDHDDWQTKREFFNQLDNMWDPFTVDRFADSHNAKTKRFYSKYFCPNTKGVNSLNYCWKKRVRKKRLGLSRVRFTFDYKELCEGVSSQKIINFKQIKNIYIHNFSC